MMFKHLLMVGLLCMSLVAVSGSNVTAGGGNATGSWSSGGCPFPPFCTLDGVFEVGLGKDQHFLGRAQITDGELGCVGPNFQNVAVGVGGISVFSEQLIEAGAIYTNPDTGRTEATTSLLINVSEFAAHCEEGGPGEDEQLCIDDRAAATLSGIPGLHAFQTFWGVGAVEDSTATCKPNPNNEQWTPWVVFPTVWTLSGSVLAKCDPNPPNEADDCTERKPRIFSCTTEEHLNLLMDDINDTPTVIYDCVK